MSHESQLLWKRLRRTVLGVGVAMRGFGTHPLVVMRATRVSSFLYFAILVVHVCVLGVDLIHLLVYNVHSARLQGWGC